MMISVNQRKSESIAYCRPSHGALVRDIKFIRVYQQLGHDVSFLGNNRGRAASTGTHLCTYEHVGFDYPCASMIVPFGTAAYNAHLFFRLRTLQPTVIHAGDLESLAASIAYKRMIRRECRVIYDVADTYSVRYRIPHWMATAIQYIDDNLMRWCEAVIVPQDNRIDNFRFRQPQRLVTIPNCPFLADAPPLTPLPPMTPLRVMLSGLLSWTRGVREVVEGAKKAGGVEVVIVGRCSDDMQTYLANSGVVSLHRETSQAEVLRLASSCHLIAAFYEPSRALHRQAASNKVFDAMAAARPVLLNSEQEAAPQVVDEWQCGYAVPYHDTEALSRLFQSLREEPSECAQIGENGRQLFEKRFHWEAMVPLIADLVSEPMIAGHAGG